MNPFRRKPTDHNIFARLSRRRFASRPATPARLTTVDRPEDDNFYFETAIASPAMQLSVWELINDTQEPPDGLPDEDELDEDVLAPGHTAPPEFWTGEQGQQLLRAFDDGPAAVSLGGWLAETFPNLYGPGGLDLENRTNAQVADVVHQLSRAAEPRLDAQALALALAAYATRAFLGGPAAESIGFRVSPLGASSCLCNIGPLGAPFRAANGSSLTVLELLLALDAQTDRGIPLAGKDTLRQQAHDLLALVNRFGDVRG